METFHIGQRVRVIGCYDGYPDDIGSSGTVVTDLMPHRWGPQYGHVHTVEIDREKALYKVFRPSHLEAVQVDA